jgi:flagellar basal body-associated protein FliL
VAKAAPAVDPAKPDDAPAKPDDAPEQLATEAPGSGTKRRLIVFGAPVALAGLGCGLWFSGVVPSLLGIRHDPPTAEADAPSQPIYVDLPELITNLNNNAPRTSYVKLTSALRCASSTMSKGSRRRCHVCKICS